MSIYLDNAATTPLSSEVFTKMEPFLFNSFANPSSTHTAGRNARYAVELSRKIIAENLNTTAEHIFFTSGGTEGDNMAILSAIHANKIKVVITSRLEHHAVLNTLRKAENDGLILIKYLDNDAQGRISLTQLNSLLDGTDQVLISLMHANNEIANLNPLEEIADLAEHYGAIFHSDTVQSIGHYHYDTRLLCPDYLVGSAHKFHGPKGVGFLYAKQPESLKSIINGGSQERGKRAGTENVSGIVGAAAAIQDIYQNQVEHESYLKSLKSTLINGLSVLPEITFNGESANINDSLSTVLSVSFPQSLTEFNLLETLDAAGIYASGGSACSGNNTSHVISSLSALSNKNTIRFSFSKYNTISEIEKVITVVKNYFQPSHNQSNLQSA